ncbi:MAG: hypothetical protein V1494_01635 [Candidatus Diapherotrites archaeon]
MNRRLLLFFALIALISFACAAENVFWLRGNDLSAMHEGGSYYFMASSFPTSTSHKTEIVKQNSPEPIEIARWYSISFSQRLLATGKIEAWFSGLIAENGSAEYRWTLYDFQTDKSTKIVQSEWSHVPFGGEAKNAAELGGLYAIEKGHKLKLVLEAKGTAGGRTRLSLDEGELNASVAFKSLFGETYSVSNVKNSAALALNLCISIACGNDSDCDDGNPLSADICVNAGTCSAACSNEECKTGCKADFECADGNPFTTDKCIGKGSCDAKCANSECTPKCSSDNECKDGLNATVDECIYPGTCIAYCKSTVCEPACSDDGECENGMVCADAGKCSAKCIQQISCGNEKCEKYENPENCSADCKTGQGISVDVLEPKKGEFFPRGEKVLVKARVESAFSDVRNAIVTAIGPFDELALSNDGSNGDEKPVDNVFTGYATISKNAADGANEMTIQAKAGNAGGFSKTSIIVAPIIDLELNTGKNDYIIGEEIIASGSASIRGNPAKATVNISINAGGKEITQQSVETDGSGAFSFRFRSLALHPLGNWLISASAGDASGNSGKAEKEIEVSAPNFTNPLQIQFTNELNAEFKRGEELGFYIALRNLDKSPFSGAFVYITLPFGSTLKAEEENSGIYTANARIPMDAPVGKGNGRITALRIDGETVYGAEKNFELEILDAEILLKMIEFNEGTEKMAGETIPLKFSAVYSSNGETLEMPAIAKIGGHQVELEKQGPVFLINYFVEERDVGKNALLLTIEDSFGNNAEKMLGVKVSGVSAQYFFLKYINLIFIGAGLIGLCALAIIMRKRIGKEKNSGTRLTEKQIMEEIKAVQTRYFKRGAVSKEKYYAEMNRLESELAELKGESK